MRYDAATQTISELSTFDLAKHFTLKDVRRDDGTAVIVELCEFDNEKSKAIVWMNNAPIALGYEDMAPTDMVEAV